MKVPCVDWRRISLVTILAMVHPAPLALSDPAAPETSTLPAPSLAGTWYEVTIECPFCPTFATQTVNLSRDATLARLADRLEIASGLQSARLVTRAQGAESGTRVVKAFHQARKNQLVLIHSTEGDGERTSDTFARVWVLAPLADHKILYGSRIVVSAFSEEAFERRGKGFRAREGFLPAERLLANLEDVRVSSLNERRKVFQPSEQVRFALEGAVCFVREGTGDAEVAAGKEQAQRHVAERAGRETLFRTLVQQGDQAYSKGDFDEALNRYKAASAILPEIALVHADLGAVYQVQAKLLEAEAAYRLAIELDPSDLDSQFNLGQVLEQAGKLPEALERYRLVLEKRPQDLEAKERVSNLTRRLTR